MFICLYMNVSVFVYSETSLVSTSKLQEMLNQCLLLEVPTIRVGYVHKV